MSKLKYLKGVRTRFCNVLHQEVKVASSFIEKSENENQGEAINNLLSDISICQERILTYIGKLEI